MTAAVELEFTLPRPGFRARRGLSHDMPLPSSEMELFTCFTQRKQSVARLTGELGFPCLPFDLAGPCVSQLPREAGWVGKKDKKRKVG